PEKKTDEAKAERSAEADQRVERDHLQQEQQAENDVDRAEKNQGLAEDFVHIQRDDDVDRGENLGGGGDEEKNRAGVEADLGGAAAGDGRILGMLGVFGAPLGGSQHVVDRDRRVALLLDVERLDVGLGLDRKLLFFRKKGGLEIGVGADRNPF